METLNESFVMRVLRKPENMLDLATHCFSKTRYLELSKVSKVRSIVKVMRSVAFERYSEAAGILSQEDGKKTNLIHSFVAPFLSITMTTTHTHTHTPKIFKRKHIIKQSSITFLCVHS